VVDHIGKHRNRIMTVVIRILILSCASLLFGSCTNNYENTLNLKVKEFHGKPCSENNFIIHFYGDKNFSSDKKLKTMRNSLYYMLPKSEKETTFIYHSTRYTIKLNKLFRHYNIFIESKKIDCYAFQDCNLAIE